MPESCLAKSRDQLRPRSPSHSNQPKTVSAKHTLAMPSGSMRPDLPEPDNFQNGSDNRRSPTCEPHNQASAPDPTLKPALDQLDKHPHESARTHTTRSKVLRPRTNPKSMAPDVAHLTDVAPREKPPHRSTPTTTRLLRSIHMEPSKSPIPRRLKKEISVDPSIPKFVARFSTPPLPAGPNKPKALPKLRTPVPQTPSSLPPDTIHFP